MRATYRWITACLILTATTNAPAGAAEHLIPGKIALVKPGALAKGVFKDAFVIDGDPTTGPATLRLLDAQAPGAGDLSISLPGTQWQGLGNPAGSKGYKYKGAGSTSDPCKVVLVTAKVIKFVCKGSGITLTPPFAGELGVVLTTQSGSRYCAAFGGSTVKNDPNLLKRKDAAVPGACPEAGPPTLGGIFVVSSNMLMRFDAATPGTISSTVAVTGLQPGENIEGIDFRPASGALYALGIVPNGSMDIGRLYVVDPLTGAATLVGAGPFASDLPASKNYGFDFNPVVDRIRVTSSADRNVRLNPDTGSPVVDSPLNPGGAQVGALAYDRNVDGATATTLFGIATATDQLVHIGGVDGLPSANGGAVTALGPLTIQVTDRTGFDIDGESGTAFAGLTDQASSMTGLYGINLSTGAATLVGLIGTGTQICAGLAIGPGGPSLTP